MIFKTCGGEVDPIRREQDSGPILRRKPDNVDKAGVP